MRRYGFLLIWFLLTACAASQVTQPAPPPSTPTVAAAESTTFPSTPTPIQAFIPKQNDLLFIEFFAVT